MATYIGKRLPREEDRRLTTGRGLYVSDARAEGMLHMAVLRSSHAHARVRKVDVEGARSLPGVFGAYGPEDLREIMHPLPVLVPDPRLDAVMPTPLANGVVRYLGDPVAVVLAEDRYLAEDGLDAIGVQYEPLPAVTDPEARDAPLLYPERKTNTLARIRYAVGDPDAAFRDAPLVAEVTLRMSRVVAHPMEPRGIFVVPDGQGRLDILAGTQGPHYLKRALARALGIDVERVRVRTPDIGGGFGVKNRIYPEDVLAAHLALRTGRPVRWTGDRREEFLSTNQERDQVHRAALAVDREGRILALRDRFVHDTGAYTTAALTVPDTTAACIPGPYRIPHLDLLGEVVVTNKAPVGPYRGAGRPQAAFVMERLMDRAADLLGMDRVEIRRRNLIRRDEMPHATGIPGRGGLPIVYDDGDYPAAMETVLEAIGYDALKHGDRASGGGYLGVGVANYVEMSTGNGFEDARVTLAENGRVAVRIGTSSQGQGHKTMVAQLAAERLGVPIAWVDVIEGDTGEISRGIGTFGSRTTVMAGNAVSRAAGALRQRVLEMAGEMLEASPDDLRLEEGEVLVAGVPRRRLPLGEIVARAGGPLEEERSFEGSYPTYGMGCHAALVEVDRKTFQIRIKDYVICHDSGVVVNPLLADGQVIGGTVQGLGTALLEELDTDPNGQIRNASFMDYLLPLASDVPDFRLFEQEFRATTNPEGVKGLAEGGTIPAAAVICSAVEDALRPIGIRIDRIPVTPRRLFEMAEGLGKGEDR